MKKNIRKKMRNYQGITLMALVITVIVLLILAGISIGLVFNSDGLFSKASNSAKRYNQKKAQEALTLVLSNATMKKYSPEGLTNEELDNMIKDIGGIIDPEDPNKVTVDGYDFEIDRDKLEVTDSLGENPNITPGGGGSGGGNQGSEEGNKKEESTLTLSATSGTITYPDTATFEITENTSNGNLSVSSSDDSIVSVSISGTTVTITPKSITESEKEAIITVKSAETEKYKEQTAVYVATVKQGGITINAVPNVRQYDGTAFDALLSVTVTPEDATVEYSLNEGAYQSKIPQIKEAGQYTITIKASKDGYVTKEESITVTVSKQSSTTGNLALLETSGTITYPNTKIVNVTNNASNGNLSVSSSNPNVATASVSNNQITITPQAVTSSGQTSTITVTSAATSNYEEQTATYTVTVNQGTISISATGYSGNYDEGSHNSVSNIVVSPLDATKTYSLNNGSYSSTIPTVSAQGTYTVKIKATKPGYADNEIQRTVTIRAMSVATAKSLVKRDGLRAHLGEEVDYNPSAGGTWRIFYYDNEVNSADSSKGYFGDQLNTLYLKRDYVSNDTSLSSYETHTPSDNGAMMRKMNPKWAVATNGSSIDLPNEHSVAWLCDPSQWIKYKLNGVANYVIGSPSVEMYMKAYNVYKDNNANSTTLINKIGNSFGYSVGAHGTYAGNGNWNGSNTGDNSIETGPHNIFMTAGSCLWLASPSSVDRYNVSRVSGDLYCVDNNYFSPTYGVCPVVSISQ